MSKTLKALIVGMLAVGCASTPTMKSVAGTYELKKGGVRVGAYKQVYLENGIIESYVNGKKRDVEFKWSIVNGEIHAIEQFSGINIGFKSNTIEVSRINKDGSMTDIAKIVEGKREDIPKDEQYTLKKIK